MAIQAGQPVELTDGGHEDYTPKAHTIAWGHPRKAIRAIPRYPLSTADFEAMGVAFSITRGIPDTSGKSYPVAQGGIHAIGS